MSRDPDPAMYLHARYYDPQVGIFLSPDPIGVAGGMNAYGYALGNPVNLADRSGLDPYICIGGTCYGNPGGGGGGGGGYPYPGSPSGGGGAIDGNPIEAIGQGIEDLIVGIVCIFVDCTPSDPAPYDPNTTWTPPTYTPWGSGGPPPGAPSPGYVPPGAGGASDPAGGGGVGGVGAGGGGGTPPPVPPPPVPPVPPVSGPGDHMPATDWTFFGVGNATAAVFLGGGGASGGFYAGGEGSGMGLFANPHLAAGGSFPVPGIATASLQFGAVRGPLRGLGSAFNLAAGPGAISVVQNANGEIVGGAAGWGPSVPFWGGIYATHGPTYTTDMLWEWLGRTIDPYVAPRIAPYIYRHKARRYWR